ncbi:PRC-barrel domain-containing protein [Kitasatospora cheerisanensis]|uniref:Photosystem reaction center subunit H n=1 Tax=Kitasatospora cheerisanensis KCTC 2395 TaxID=1348663 RepID=A0A066YJL6_9ACTN|nr:PRC-barrel domain-containing protein [Kitasatospora cheerisanensis]KDN81362.1 photosystem reaction center subunit H [Kitasatospora cheerisanensis KCTC 2395]
MIEIADIREWRGQDVVDQDAKKIGSLENIYVDTATDQPFFATVTVGMLGRHRLVFVPITDAVVGPAYLRVPFGRGEVKNAPSIDTDGVLPAEQEPEVFAHYQLEYVAGASGERRLARR